MHTNAGDTIRSSGIFFPGQRNYLATTTPYIRIILYVLHYIVVGIFRNNLYVVCSRDLTLTRIHYYRTRREDGGRK